MERKCILAIRIRGEINSPRRIRDTLRMLRVDRNMTATLLDDRPEYLGMLQKAKDYVTWGEPNLDMIHRILEKRGRLLGNHPINDDSLSSLGYKDIGALAKALYDGDTEYHKLEGIKPFFRLHPPRKGFKRTVKRPYRSQGELGYRGEAINKLAKRMC